MGSLIREVFGQGPKVSGRLRYGAPDRKTQKIPLRTRRSFTRSTPRARSRGFSARSKEMAITAAGLS